MQYSPHLFIYQDTAWHWKLFGMEEISSQKILSVDFLSASILGCGHSQALRQRLNGQLRSLHIKKLQWSCGMIID